MFIKKRVLIAALLVALTFLSALAFKYFRGNYPPILSLIEKPVECDLLIKNGVILDGTGGKSFTSDIAIAGDKIVRIGRFRVEAEKVIDADGLVVAPGFINPHSHIDQTIFEQPEAKASLLQGVTTEIVGLDGLSAVKLDRHFKQISTNGTGVNYGSLIGQGSIRQVVLGNSDRPASQEETAAMQALVTEAMEQGAFGLSTGLEYIPGVFTPTNEIIELAKAVSPYKGVYVSHIRNERDNVAAAVKEALEIGRATDVPVVISHIKIGSSIFNGSREQVIARNTQNVIKAITDYRKNGGKAYADLYPYLVSWFQMNKLPRQTVWTYPGEMILVSASSNKDYIGKTITEIAEIENVPASEVVQQLISDPLARVCVNNLSEASLRSLMKQPFVVIGMDNTTYWGDPSYIPPQHPRNSGTYPRVLAEYVRRHKILTLAEAVHKMTGLTAQIYGIEKRGLIREGYFADLVIFDPETVNDRATYSQPGLPPKGVEYVMINGQLAVEENQFKGIRAGKILRRSS